MTPPNYGALSSELPPPSRAARMIRQRHPQPSDSHALASPTMAQTNPETGWQDWFEHVWEHREEVLYPSLFGHISRGIFPIQAEMITETFKQATFDPRWLHYGVIEFAPTQSRSSWLYVTSG